MIKPHRFITLHASDGATGARFVSKLQRQEQKRFPACFSSREQFDGWKVIARMSHPHSGICTDCSPEHKFEMERQNRCMYPQVVFKVNKEGDLEGYLPAQLKKEMRQANEESITSASVRVDDSKRSI